MKKKCMCIIVIVLIAANVFFCPTPVTNNQSHLSLVLLEAKADGEVEDDPPDPGDEFPPLRTYPNPWTLSAIIDYFF